MIFEPNKYFKQIAISHVDIADTEEKPAYFREYSSIQILFNNSDFLDKMRYAKRFALVSQWNMDGNINGPNADQKIRTHTGSIYLISRLITKDIDQAYKDTNSVLEEILAKMEEDQTEGKIPFTFNLNDIPIFSLGEIADGYYGHIALMSYKESACKAVDPKKWK